MFFRYISLGGSPLRGLIQDHVVSGFRMICRDAFYERDVYQQLLYAALGDIPGRVLFLPPAIMKPKRLWTGKQIVTSILSNLCRGRYVIAVCVCVCVCARARMCVIHVYVCMCVLVYLSTYARVRA